jgi:hypothetical protein
MTQTITQTLSGYIRELTGGDATTKPAAGETWARMLKRIAVYGQVAEVDKETYWHFLEVLPPQWMDGIAFCCAEGMEPFRLFWRKGERYFCRRLTWEETFEFCDLADLRRDYYFY